MSGIDAVARLLKASALITALVIATIAIDGLVSARAAAEQGSVSSGASESVGSSASGSLDSVGRGHLAAGAGASNGSSRWSVGDVARAAHDEGAGLLEAEGLRAVSASELPEDIVREVLSPLGSSRVIADQSYSVLGILDSGSADAGVLARQLEASGWMSVGSQHEGIISLAKHEGSCRWMTLQAHAREEAAGEREHAMTDQIVVITLARTEG